MAFATIVLHHVPPAVDQPPLAHLAFLVIISMSLPALVLAPAQVELIFQMVNA
jgi:hypothetical protein